MSCTQPKGKALVAECTETLVTLQAKCVGPYSLVCMEEAFVTEKLYQ